MASAFIVVFAGYRGGGMARIMYRTTRFTYHDDS